MARPLLAGAGALRGGKGASARLLDSDGSGCRQRDLGAGHPVRLGRDAQGYVARARREWPQQPRHPRRRDDLSQLCRLLEPLRPSFDIRAKDSARRRPLLRLHQDRARAGRGFQRLAGRHVGHLQAPPQRHLPRCRPGDRSRCQMVARPRRHGRRLSDLPDGRRQPAEARAVRRPRRPHDPHRLSAQGQAHPARSRGGSAGGVQFEARPKPRQRQGSLGDGVDKNQRRRRRRLQARTLGSGPRDRLHPLRGMEERTVAEDPPRGAARGACLGQSARADGAR